MTDVQRSIKRARVTCLAAALAVPLGAFLFGSELAAGSPLAPVPAACIVALLAIVVMQVRVIGILQRTRHFNWRTEQRELAARAIRENAQSPASCSHPDAEPVDLSTGERVAWVCPGCDADLPAGWTPQAKSTGTLTATGPFPGTAALSGTGSLSAKPRQAACECGHCDGSHEGPAVSWFRDTRRIASGGPGGIGQVHITHYPEPPLSGSGSLSAPMTGPGGRWRPLSELPGTRQGDGEPEGIPAEALIDSMRQELEAAAPGYAGARAAAEHFAALARVGRDRCIGFCAMCAERDRS